MTDSSIDLDVVEEGVRLILKGIGEDPDREGLLETPRRVARMYRELFECAPLNATQFVNEERFDGLVIERNIQFSSLCEHHMLPFLGTASLGYLPGGSYLGLSKLARIVERTSRRLQVQERMSHQIAHWLLEQSGGSGAAVVVRARHLCMEMRGVRKVGTETVTVVLLGEFKRDAVLAERFLRIA